MLIDHDRLQIIEGNLAIAVLRYFYDGEWKYSEKIL